MHGPLAFSLNDDGTVTLRCDADAFFAHANEIRRLLTGPGEDDEQAEPQAAATPRRAPRRAPAPGNGSPQPLAATAVVASAPEPGELDAFWERLLPEAGSGRASRDLSRGGIELLVAGYYLTRERGFEAFSRRDLQRALDSLDPRLGGPRAVKSGSLIHLARKDWLERVRRGAYRLSRRAVDRVESLRKLDTLPPAPQPPVPALPSLIGLSRFLREVPSNRKWRRVLLVAYFLHEHCGIEEFDRRLLAACFKRLRGIDTPGSLPSLISQVLHKRRGLLERGAGRGMYRLTPQAVEDLRRNPRVAQADAIHRSKVLRAVARTG